MLQALAALLAVISILSAVVGFVLMIVSKTEQTDVASTACLTASCISFSLLSLMLGAWIPLCIYAVCAGTYLGITVHEVRSLRNPVNISTNDLKESEMKKTSVLVSSWETIVSVIALMVVVGVCWFFVDAVVLGNVRDFGIAINGLQVAPEVYPAALILVWLMTQRMRDDVITNGDGGWNAFLRWEDKWESFALAFLAIVFFVWAYTAGRSPSMMAYLFLIAVGAAWDALLSGDEKPQGSALGTGTHAGVDTTIAHVFAGQDAHQNVIIHPFIDYNDGGPIVPMRRPPAMITQAPASLGDPPATGHERDADAPVTH